jgi:hypothetical protein
VLHSDIADTMGRGRSKVNFALFNVFRKGQRPTKTKPSLAAVSVRRDDVKVYRPLLRLLKGYVVERVILL